MPEILSEIQKTEANKAISKIIERGIILGQKDRAVMGDIPVSESVYYRWKSRLIDKIYEIYISEGFVGREEILSETIE